MLCDDMQSLRNVKVHKDVSLWKWYAATKEVQDS